MQKLEDKEKVAGKCDSIAPKTQKHAAMNHCFSRSSFRTFGATSQCITSCLGLAHR
jgi:hypothetical protein